MQGAKDDVAMEITSDTFGMFRVKEAHSQDETPENYKGKLPLIYNPLADLKHGRRADRAGTPDHHLEQDTHFVYWD